MPKISVVIPVFNTEKHLDACLNSLLRQTMTDFEVICVDDCSSDRSAKIANRFKKIDSRIRVVSHDVNLGAGGARNTGIRAANSEFVAFSDSDDFFEVNALEILWDASFDGKYDIVAAGYNVVAIDGSILSQHRPERRKLENMRDAGSPLLLTNPSFWNKLWRRGLFVDHDIFFPERLYWEDLATIPRLVSVARNMNCIDQICYNYVDRPESYTNAASDKHIVDYLRVFEILRKFLIENNTFEVEEGSFRNLVKINFNYHIEKISARRTLPEHKLAEYVSICELVRDGYLKTYPRAETSNVPQAGKTAEARSLLFRKLRKVLEGRQ